MLNVDWFRPFKHSQYSAGIVYLVIQNLPRSMRFKPENILFVSCIPGPKEPKSTINSYLQPLCDELIRLWKGIWMKSPDVLLGYVHIRVALVYISCDLPAMRKVCGFYSYSAKQVCSKCLKTFTFNTN